MPRYFFHLVEGVEISEDPDGSVLPDFDAARRYALQAARELLAESIKYAGRPPPDAVIIVDQQGKKLSTIFATEVLPEKIRRLLT